MEKNGENEDELTIEQTIYDYLNDIRRRKTGHSLASSRYNKYDKLLGYPATIIGAFLSSSLMSSILLNNSGSMTLTGIMLFLSVSGFLLSSTRDYFQFYNKFHLHDSSTKLYANLVRTIESQLYKIDLTHNDKISILNNMTSQVSIIEMYELPLPCDIEELSIKPKKISINGEPSKELRIPIFWCCPDRTPT
jgi:hypothetical protein